MDGLARVLETARKRREDGSVADLANCTTGLDGLQFTMGSDSRCGIWWGGRVDGWSAMWIAGPLVCWLDGWAAGWVAGALRLLVGRSLGLLERYTTWIAGALHHRIFPPYGIAGALLLLFFAVEDCWGATPQDCWIAK